jgi:hypothetical protein
MAPSDLAGFQHNFGLPSQTVAKFVGPNDPTNVKKKNFLVNKKFFVLFGAAGNGGHFRY